MYLIYTKDKSIRASLLLEGLENEAKWVQDSCLAATLSPGSDGYIEVTQFEYHLYKLGLYYPLVDLINLLSSLLDKIGVSGK
jgi:hypothetical protein